MRTYKKPLGRSIAAGCILFTAILCLTLSILNYYNQKRSMYSRYRSNITDILKYVDSYIDDDDLIQCIETQQESETYKQTLLIMDDIMNEFSIHYLYIIKPLNTNETGNMMSVMSAEDDYNRYVDTEGNLYLGWVSDDEFDAQTAELFFDVMKQEDIVFFVEQTEWSTDYTGALPLKDGNGEGYAVLCVDLDITTLQRELWDQALKNAAVIVLLGIAYTVMFLLWTKTNITGPVMLLEEGVVDYAGRSHGQHDVNALKFEAPPINTENEVESLAKAITKMTEDMQNYVLEILAVEQKTRDLKKYADAMSELAVVDSLTGVRNKTAFIREIAKLDDLIAEDVSLPFGMAMVDLNYLKVINDTYGHEKGDDALRMITQIVCTVFRHSPVFRIGGDEFAVILRGHDYQHIDDLQVDFSARVSQGYMETEPWSHVSAAIGVALYDADSDECVDDVLRRADKAMYAQKMAMKATRNDAIILLNDRASASQEEDEGEG